MSSTLLPTSRSVRRPQASRGWSVQRLVVRTLVILVVAGVVVGAATAIGYSPLAANLPAPFLSPGAGGPADPAPDAAGQATTAAPSARGLQARTTGQPADAGGQAPASSGQGLLGGRNAPSLSRGLSEEVRYVVVFAILTAIVVLALRVLGPRRRRRTSSPATAGA